MSDHVLSVTESDFQSVVIESEVPVLVDFWAAWCGPCRALAPTFEEVAAEYVGKVKFVKVNVDDAGALSAKYGVRSIPTLLIFKSGLVEATQIGGLGKSELMAFIDSNV